MRERKHVGQGSLYSVEQIAVVIMMPWVLPQTEGGPETLVPKCWSLGNLIKGWMPMSGDLGKDYMSFHWLYYL